jgi:hydroxymethylpyrimidine pyrophosphatase-like HAD family hydrolase/energy-coupling factor transporter ATP-binding protein EcfA2
MLGSPTLVVSRLQIPRSDGTDPMIVHALAVDYDGTIATEGRLAPETARALARVRESGRKLLLVTGRLLPDLRRVCPDVETLFDAIVAENGAVVYTPTRRDTRLLGGPPEPALIEALTHQEVPFDVGASILATEAVLAERALTAIREAGVERTLVFNKDSLMLLPGGVTKGTGLLAALGSMALSAHNVVAVGDAENDHAFLALAECAVAVANAIPALQERADHVTRAPNGRGVIELIEEHVLDDLSALLPTLTRHHLTLGHAADGTPVALPAHRASVLIVGPSESGKSTLTGLLVERIARAGRSLCLFDPEGDHQAFTDLEGAIVLGGKTERALATPDEVGQLLQQPAGRLVLNLSALSMAEKVSYATKVLAVVSSVRAASGLPHWLIIDEAHHIVPAEGSAAVDLVRAGAESMALITMSPDLLAADVRREVRTMLSTDPVAAAGGLPLARGETMLIPLDGSGAPSVRFRVAPREVEHRRHLRKYTEGELPTERSFYFRGPEAKLNLRAVNLVRFVELAEGVDEATWSHHLRAGDYSRWLRQMIKDAELADEIAAIERTPHLPPAESRRRVLDALRARYAV